ncbi:LytR C-terminal domain-containing protein [Blastococcus sp. Marseille-P5729]|uniref:LytR C-terminal domain-containing protein n=1 Tax=Blastococcus sp. Marseille-P5729 TaxID=2086582 RepID=UPI000D110FC4|nr:LytR C-terminal domain-containing protein [Blastococcus sp. Marseille-P5729]
MLTRPDVRRRRIIGALAIAVGATLLVLALLAITGVLGAVDGAKSASDEAVSAGASSSSGGSEEADSPPSDEKAPLTVLNGSDTSGLAGQGRDAFEAEGWTVEEVGNLSDAEPPAQSTVYYPAGDDAAKAAAESLADQFSELTVQQAPDGFPYDGVVVVLTGEWEPGA